MQNILSYIKKYNFPPLLKKFFSSGSLPGSKTNVMNIDLHYEKVGCGDKNILLLPGALGSTRTDFAPQLEKLDRTAFTVIAWDPPGYGFSRPPNRIFSKEFLHYDAKLAAALMEKLGYKKFSILGWSDGGVTGLIMAAKYPHNVQKLVIWGACSHVTKHDGKCLEATRDITKWSEKMRSPLELLYGKKYFKDTWENYVDCVTSFIGETGMWNICNEELKNISCSTFIIHGDKDPLLDPIHPNYLLKNIKNSRLFRIPDGKHNIHLRYTDKFNKLVHDFICE